MVIYSELCEFLSVLCGKNIVVKTLTTKCTKDYTKVTKKLEIWNTCYIY
jgi:hypothetical protein